MVRGWHGAKLNADPCKVRPPSGARVRNSTLPFTVVSVIRGPPAAPTCVDRWCGSIRPLIVIGKSLFGNIK